MTVVRFIYNRLPSSVKSIIPSAIRRMKYYMLSSAKELQKNHDINQIQKIEACLNVHGYSIEDFVSILDFGCGYGRLTKYLPYVAINADIYGCDVDRDAIFFAKKNYPRVNF